MHVSCAMGQLPNEALFTVSKVYKTCLFKVHNPSKRKQAMMLDSMRRADRAYWMLLDSVEEQVKALVGKDKKVVREGLGQLKKLIEKKVLTSL